MKINIIGWTYIIFGTFLIIMSGLYIFSTLQFLSPENGEIGKALVHAQYPMIYINSIRLVFYIIGVVWALALLKHKRWSWYFGFCYVPIVLAGSIYYVIQGLGTLEAIGAPIFLAAALFNIFVIYSLISDRKLFLQVFPTNI